MILCENIFRAPQRPSGEDGAFSQKIDYVTILNFEWHPNSVTGSRVSAILMNGWVLPIGGGSAVEGLQSTGLPRLFYYLSNTLP